MEVTLVTWIVAVVGLLVMGLLLSLQFIAIIRPRAAWTIRNVYGSDPEGTDSRAYFAFYQGYAWVDVLIWGPLQMAGSVGMLLGERWGFLLALVGSVPFWYSSIPFFIWDRDLGFRQNTLFYWIIVWGIFPVFGVVEMVYCLTRLL